MKKITAEFLEKQRGIIEERIARYMSMARDPQMITDEFRGPYLDNKFEHGVPKGQRALAKMTLGTYNECDECGEEIGVERLEAIPAALLCITCQTRQEKN